MIKSIQISPNEYSYDRDAENIQRLYFDVFGSKEISNEKLRRLEGWVIYEDKELAAFLL